jgi:hypothetical protein
MADPVKFLSQHITLTTANTVSNGTLIRLINLDGANTATITQKYSNGNIISSFALGHHGTDFGSVFVIKGSTDTLTANDVNNSAAYTGLGIKAVSVGYY